MLYQYKGDSISATSNYCDLAKHNYDFYKSIPANQYLDWQVTTMYYTAIHWVNGFLLRKYPLEYVVRGHEDRLNFLKRKSPTMYKNLAQLYYECRAVRYNPERWKQLNLTEIQKLTHEFDELKHNSNS
jgi:hypothetical protein